MLKFNSETTFLSQLFKVNSNVIDLKPCKIINEAFFFLRVLLCFIAWKPCKMFIYVCMYVLLCCSTPRSETHLPPRCSRASVYRSTCACWYWADYRIRWIGTLRWAPTLVSARATRLNKGRSSAQHVDHLTQNRRCLPPTRVAFEHLATAVVAGHLMGRVRGLRHRQRLQHIRDE